MSELVEVTLKGTEEKREYAYEDGFAISIDAPVTLWMKGTEPGASHRVLGEDGWTVYIPKGWRILRWRGKTEF